MAIEQRRDETGTVTVCLVACPFCGNDIDSRYRVRHLEQCSEVSR